MPARSSTSIAVLVLCLGSACAGIPGGGKPAALGRSLLATDTATTPAGRFSLEAGVTFDPGDLLDTPLTLRYGTGPNTEVFVEWAPLVHVESGSSDETGVSDLILAGTWRFFGVDGPEGTSAALIPLLKLPTADEDEGLGSGEVDGALAASLTHALDGLAVTCNYDFQILGESGGGSSVGHAIALAAATIWDERFSAFGELAAELVPEEDTDSVFTTLGAGWAPHPRLTLDLSLRVGLSDDAPDFQVLVGLTRDLGALFGGRD